jgi:hypothetical protein
MADNIIISDLELEIRQKACILKILIILNFPLANFCLKKENHLSPRLLKNECILVGYSISIPRPVLE